MKDNKFHAFYYKCPQCQKTLIGCDNVDCDHCDRYNEEENNCVDLPAIWAGNIRCKCHYQHIVANLVCENMELQEEVASLIEQLKAVYFKIDNTF